MNPEKAGYLLMLTIATFDTAVILQNCILALSAEGNDGSSAERLKGICSVLYWAICNTGFYDEDDKVELCKAMAKVGVSPEPSPEDKKRFQWLPSGNG